MKHRYGELPKVIGQYIANPNEMMFYQDMLIKDKGVANPSFENRLKCFGEIIEAAITNYIDSFGMQDFLSSYVYLSAKYLFQPKQEPFNRPGWHCDGFMTNDVNYIWSDNNPTVFNFSQFKLSMNDALSMIEMENQAKPENNFCYKDNCLIRLNQYNVHRVAEVTVPGMRAFVKVSFSKDRFDLLGNSHNYTINYDWEMKPRSQQRNIPQSIISQK